MARLNPVVTTLSRSWLGATIFTSAVLGFAVVGDAADGGSSLVVGLAKSTDLEPGRFVADRGGETRSRPAAATQASARQSVPAVNRAASYQEDVFRNSKVAVPLLVIDLELRALSGVRPMSGRSVGATPAAAWTRSPLTSAIESSTSTNPRQ